MRRDATASTLTSRQRQAIEAILATGDVSIAAQSVGVNRATLYRWMKQPAFVQAVHSAEADAVEDLSRMLVRLGRTAVATLAKAMNDPATPASTKVRAADATLSRLLQLRELATLEQRVAALEASLGPEEKR
jgi:transposase-like protein